jgi:hypothetical protein
MGCNSLAVGQLVACLRSGDLFIRAKDLMSEANFRAAKILSLTSLQTIRREVRKIWREFGSRMLIKIEYNLRLRSTSSSIAARAARTSTWPKQLLPPRAKTVRYNL